MEAGGGRGTLGARLRAGARGEHTSLAWGWGADSLSGPAPLQALAVGVLAAWAAFYQGPGLRPSLSASLPRCPGTGDSSGSNELSPLSGGPGLSPGPTLAQLLSRVAPGEGLWRRVLLEEGPLAPACCLQSTGDKWPQP